MYDHHMNFIKNKLNSKILKLKVEHNQLTLHQAILEPYSSPKTLQWNMMELKKSFIELKISILKAMTGESK
jgi:hypothetical protein